MADYNQYLKVASATELNNFAKQMKQCHDKIESLASYDKLVEAYRFVVLKKQNPIECATNAKYTAVGCMLYNSNLSSACADLLQLIINELDIEAEAVKAMYKNGQYTHFYVSVKYNNQLFILDPVQEVVLEGDCFFKFFMLNKQQITDMNNERYASLDLEQFGTEYVDYFTTKKLIAVDLPTLREMMMDIAQQDVTSMLWQCPPSFSKDDIKGYFDNSKIFLRDAASELQAPYFYLPSSILIQHQIVWVSLQKNSKKNLLFVNEEHLTNEISQMLKTANSILELYVSFKNDKKLVSTGDAVKIVQQCIWSAKQAAGFDPSLDLQFSFDEYYMLCSFEPGTKIDSNVRFKIKDNYRYYQQFCQHPQVLQQILIALTSFQQHIKINPNLKLTADNFSAIQNIIQKDWPELWWFETPLLELNEEKHVIGIPITSYSEAEIIQFNKQLDDYIANVKKVIVNPNQFYLQALFHSIQVLRIDAADENVRKHQHTIIGLLKQIVHQSSVGKCFKWLCDNFGMHSIVVSGAAQGDLHSWNIMKIQDQFYHTDTILNLKNNNLYFNVDDRIILRDHIIQQQLQVPKCYSMSQNIFQQQKRRIFTHQTNVPKQQFKNILKNELLKMQQKGMETKLVNLFFDIETQNLLTQFPLHESAIEVQIEERINFRIKNLIILNNYILQMTIETLKTKVCYDLPNLDNAEKGIRYLTKTDPSEMSEIIDELKCNGAIYEIKGKYIEFVLQ
ncbi:Transglutaminase-like_superfamily protein [Hexamita inflata]|uniref:Transglutaminase-like_superfamily protein n=1 Tax=Hexamita inflata TaxID=28002 RepID=A0ABP1H148_9EUKA